MRKSFAIPAIVAAGTLGVLVGCSQSATAEPDGYVQKVKEGPNMGDGVTFPIWDIEVYDGQVVRCVSMDTKASSGFSCDWDHLRSLQENTPPPSPATP